MLNAGKRFFTGSFQPDVFARLVLPVNVLLIILLAHGLARLSWTLLPSPPLPIAIAESVGGPTATPSISDVNYSTIADWHLFGQLEVAKPAPPPMATAPETKLNLKLAGIFYAENGGKPLALIAEGGGEEQSYTIGAQLSGGVRLTQILRDRVVLSRNGRLEVLSLPQETEGIDTPPPSAPAAFPQLPPDDSYQSGLDEPYQPELDEPYQPELDESYQPQLDEPYQPELDESYQPQFDESYQPELDESYQPELDESYQPQLDESYQPEAAATTGVTVDASAVVNRFRAVAATQPEALQELAFAQPYVQKGEFMGFRLRPGRDQALLQQLGLRNGDVITEINGIRLDDPAIGASLLPEVIHANQLTVQVLRNGIEIPFTFYMNSQ